MKSNFYRAALAGAGSWGPDGTFRTDEGAVWRGYICSKSLVQAGGKRRLITVAPEYHTSHWSSLVPELESTCQGVVANFIN